jgi:hypothetical protein
MNTGDSHHYPTEEELRPISFSAYLKSPESFTPEDILTQTTRYMIRYHEVVTDDPDAEEALDEIIREKENWQSLLTDEELGLALQRAEDILAIKGEMEVK